MGDMKDSVEIVPARKHPEYLEKMVENEGVFEVLLMNVALLFVGVCNVSSSARFSSAPEPSSSSLWCSEVISYRRISFLIITIDTGGLQNDNTKNSKLKKMIF